MASIFDLDAREGEGKSFERSSGLRRDDDYEKINNQMDSLQNQKEELMNKLNNFAETLKLRWFIVIFVYVYRYENTLIFPR